MIRREIVEIVKENLKAVTRINFIDRLLIDVILSNK